MSDRYEETNRVCSNFKNGVKMYRESALFNRAVQMIVRGENVYHVLEQVIHVAEDCQRALEQQLLRSVNPPYMISQHDTKHNE